MNFSVPVGLNWNEQSAGSAVTVTLVWCALCRAGLATWVSILNTGI